MNDGARSDRSFRTHSARRRQRIEAQAYYVAFPVAMGVAFAVTGQLWMRVLVALGVGAVVRAAIGALATGLRHFYQLRRGYKPLNRIRTDFRPPDLGQVRRVTILLSMDEGRLFAIQLGCLAALSMVAASCGSSERALSLAELRSALTSGGAGRVYVHRAPNGDYVNVGIDSSLLIVRFDQIARAKDIEAHVRAVYRSGTQVQRRMRVCNLVVYSLNDERRSTRAHAQTVVRMLAERCS